MNQLITKLRNQTWDESMMLRAEIRTPATGWHNKAACRGSDPDLFFERHGHRDAIQICKTCPVMLDCGAEAWQNENGGVYFYGVYGAVAPLQRQLHHERRRRAHRAHTANLVA
jgi:hypothetical protein